MDGIFLWIRNIAIFLVISEILFQLLPQGNYRKYGKLFTGLVMVLLVASPLGGLWDLEERINSLSRGFAMDQSLQEGKILLQEGEETQQELVKREYLAIIQSQVEDLVREDGYQVVDCEADMEMNPEAEGYGDISFLKVTLKSENKEDRIWVEKVKVESIEMEESTSNTYTSTHLPEIRRKLLDWYQLEDDRLSLILEE